MTICRSLNLGSAKKPSNTNTSSMLVETNNTTARPINPMRCSMLDASHACGKTPCGSAFMGLHEIRGVDEATLACGLLGGQAFLVLDVWIGSVLEQKCCHVRSVVFVIRQHEQWRGAESRIR